MKSTKQKVLKDKESVEEDLHFLLARATGLFETVETRWAKFIAQQTEEGESVQKENSQ